MTLPELPFVAEHLRLNSGEVLQISHSNGRASLSESPGLGRAQMGRLSGTSSTCTHTARVKLHQLGTDFGAALEMNGCWQPLDGSATLDAAMLRTHRLLAKVKDQLSTDKDLCWMEGSRTLAGLRNSEHFWPVCTDWASALTWSTEPITAQKSKWRLRARWWMPVSCDLCRSRPMGDGARTCPLRSLSKKGIHCGYGQRIHSFLGRYQET